MIRPAVADLRSIPLVLLMLLAACDDDASSQDAGAGADAAASTDAGPPADAGPAVDPLLGADDVALVESGFQFTEGPQWLPGPGKLVFSDIDGNTIYQLDDDGAPASPFLTPSHNSNGIALAANGADLIVAEHGLRRVERLSSTGASLGVVADTFEGKKLNSPNDVIVRSDGTVYFTDPPYGIQDGQRELDFVGVFRVPATGGAPVAEWRGALAQRPNGIGLSPDERTLYVADTNDGVVRAYDVATDGSLSGERELVDDVPFPDGLAIDSEGNLFVTCSEGIRVYAPDGTLWGTLTMPEPAPMQPANCAFGDADRRTLYITARQSLYRVHLAIPGL